MILADINTKGYIEIENFFNVKNFEKLQNKVNKLIEKKPNTNFTLTDLQLDNENIVQFEDIPGFRELIENFYKFENKKLNFNDCYKVLRVLKGNDSNKDNSNFHFDGFYLTAMFPIIIPQNNSGDNGDFVIVPNIRRIYKSKLINNLIKAIFQNFLIKIFYKTKLFNYFFNAKVIRPKEGSLILFRGFQSLHGSAKLEKNRTRATLLYHISNMKN